MNDARLEALFENASDAFEESVSRYSVGIIFGEQGQHLDIATGIAVQWKKRKLIVTAKHIFGASDEKELLTLILPRDRPLNRTDVTPLPPLDLDCLVQISNLPIVRCSGEDLAFFEVNERFGNNSDLQYFQVRKNASCPDAGTRCLLSGFPRDLSGRLSSNEVLANLANRWSEICRPADEHRFLKDFDSQLHFLMKFHKANKGKQPEGFSGGGVWFALRESSEGQIWHPVPGLAGIQSRWFPTSAVTLAVRVEHLVRFLLETLG